MLALDPNPIEISLPKGKSVYFISDVHLGLPSKVSSLERERLLLRWLDEVSPNAGAIFILGDLFDFWFEYKTVVPKGYTRLLGKLALLSDQGLRFFFFVGNHDLWMKDYFETELGIPIYHQPKAVCIDQKTFWRGHGDGIAPKGKDQGYKFIKKIFIHPIFQRLFQGIHPDIGIALGSYLSRRKKKKDGKLDFQFFGENKEWLVQYSQEILDKGQQFDFFIFVHRHLHMQVSLAPHKAHYINLGEWVTQFTYALFEHNTQEVQLIEYPNNTAVLPVEQYVKRYEENLL